VSVLTAEFNLDVAKKVWREEHLEEFAIKLLRRNRPIDEIIEDTGLEYEEIEILRANI